MFIKPIIDWIFAKRKYNDLLTKTRFVLYVFWRRGKTNNRSGSFMLKPDSFITNKIVKNSMGHFTKNYSCKSPNQTITKG